MNAVLLTVSVEQALLVGAGLVLVVGFAGAPFSMAKREHPGPSATVFVAEPEGERLQRQEREIEDADSVAGPATESGAGGPQGGHAATGGLPT